MSNDFLRLFNEMYPREVEDMRADVVDKGDFYSLEISMPNFTKDEIKVEFTPDKYLIVSAEKREVEDKKYIEQEILQKVRRQWYPGDDYSPEDFSAEFDSGMLLIKIAKKNKSELDEKVAQIEVK